AFLRADAIAQLRGQFVEPCSLQLSGERDRLVVELVLVGLVDRAVLDLTQEQLVPPDCHPACRNHEVSEGWPPEVVRHVLLDAPGEVPGQLDDFTPENVAVDDDAVGSIASDCMQHQSRLAGLFREAWQALDRADAVVHELATKTT